MKDLYFDLALFAGLVMLGLAIAWLFARFPRRIPSPLIVAPAAAQRHFPLIVLIRGVELMILLPILFVVLLIGFGFIVTMHDFLWSQATGYAPRALYLVALIVILAVLGRKIVTELRSFRKSGRPWIKNLWTVNTNNISNFSLIFAAFASHDIYHLMPPTHINATSPSAGLFDRDMVWIFIFFGLWKSTNVLLGRILELNSPVSSPPPDDPDIPEYPLKSRPFPS